MNNRVIWSFLSVVALGTSSLVAGCDSDAKLARSGLGESCYDTASCEDGLKCVQGTCVQRSSSTGGSASTGDGGADPGTSGSTSTGGTTTVVPPVLGREGESCTKRADCEDGLGCFSARCQKDNDGAGGEDGGSGGPTLGGIGETCGLTTDCAKGLKCLPQGEPNINVKAIGSNSVGVCTPTDSGLEPTGKSCHGAECVEAADCCQLPVEMHATLNANSCAQLAELLDGVDCDAPSAAEKPLCFANSVYCDCASKTWSCNDSGRCVYDGACDVATPGFVPGGCPTLSRAGYSLFATCNEDTERCEPATVEPTCKKDADCEGELVADSVNAEVCVGSECTCYKATGACYVKCSENLDCAIGQACDTETKVCVPAEQCTNDAFCALAYDDLNYKCIEGTCAAACANDLDCNYGSLTNGGYTQVCEEGKCVPVGCSDDSECSGTQYGVKLFCTETPAVDPAGGPHSAITD